MSAQPMQELKQHLGRVYDLINAARVLEWDSETYMPDGGVEGRSHQMATLRTIAFETFTQARVGELFESLAAQAPSMDPDSDDARLVKVGHHYYQRQVRLPARLVTELNELRGRATHAWREARAASDFASFQPLLEAMVKLQIEMAQALHDGSTPNIYDALLEEYEPGLTSADVDAVFQPLKPELVKLIERVAAKQDAVSDAPLHGQFDQAAQLEFSSEVVKALGYDFTKGRLDLVTHPFCITFAPGDVRITTRVQEDFLPSCLMGVIHESGHAMYEQGVSQSLYRLGLFPDVFGEGAGMAAHESQSRFYENVLGRSRAFWQHFFPLAQSKFPQLKGISLDAWYRALNASRPSYIRVEADELTYGMHIMLRYEIENGLINGRMQVKDLPEIWNSKMQEYLGITPPDNGRHGVMQDVHWSAGLFGYFPDYLLGSIFSVQLWEALQRDIPEAQTQVAQGEFGPILTWMRTRIHEHGRKFTLVELATRAAGQPLVWKPYINYLETKMSEVYGI